MSPRSALVVAPVIVALVLTFSAAAAEPFAFRAGFAERDITPPIGSEQPGGYEKAFHKSLHDPCKVRAAVFDDGASAVAIVGVDALALHSSTCAEARKRIADRTALAGSAVLIAASHSHSSGPTCMIMPGEFDHASEAVRKLAYEHSSCADAKYLAKVTDAIVDAVVAAYEARRPAKGAVGRGEERTVAFNRRFKMRDGRTVTHPNPGNPDMVEPAGPIDPEVGVIGAWDSDGKLLGCVVTFACHATTNPGGISANYVYYLERVIQGYYGKDVPVVFVNGASGDVTQVDNRSPYRRPSPEQWAQLTGGKVGAEALKVLFELEPTAKALGPVTVKREVLSIPRRRPSPAHVTAAHEQTKQPPPKDNTEWLFAKETILLDAKLQKEPIAECEVQAVQVGPAVFLTTPAEYFCRFGLEQKAASPFPFTFPVSLANGCVGYVPTEDAFSATGGGYETRLTSYSNLEPAAGAKLRDAGIALAKQLTPGPVPIRPKTLPFAGKAWSYGVNPPQLD
jgi:neutral ceramidase